MSGRGQHLVWLLSHPEVWLAIAVYLALIMGAVLCAVRAVRREGRARLLYGAGFILLGSLIALRLATIMPMFRYYVSGGSA
ncbi:hypothetical protein HK107_13710 [Parvularcula sp. ZS-1/3]|uniref:Uncharacterized protein n=1 Tax=Parvularcula mediterranea TaxID=2732508 RepID=A0A7Y3RNL7_9PROT|nr:hypothetical protein [Parvularcula mediterranea]NNU17383.1 hypothetical protein [Parvularcula mediterranea]